MSLFSLCSPILMFLCREDIYKELRGALIERVNDKEIPVRVQAVIAISKLCGTEHPSEVSKGEQTVSDMLIDILAHDTSS
jgi:condensin complex subunit 3